MTSEPHAAWHKSYRGKDSPRNGPGCRIRWWWIFQVLVSSAVLLIAIFLPQLALAQVNSPQAPSAWTILEEDLLILFRILVVATVIERLLEYLSLTWPHILKVWNWLRSRLGSRMSLEPGDLPEEVRKICKQLTLQGLGILLGIAICWRAHLGIFAQLEETASGRLGEAITGWFVHQAGTWLDYAITGILVGLGTEPIHSIINTILRRRDLRRTRLAQAG